MLGVGGGGGGGGVLYVSLSGPCFTLISHWPVSLEKAICILDIISIGYIMEWCGAPIVTHKFFLRQSRGRKRAIKWVTRAPTQHFPIY